MLYLPIIAALLYLNQLMLSKMSLFLFYITHNIFRIADITFRIERVNGDLFFLGLYFIV